MLPNLHLKVVTFCKVGGVLSWYDDRTDDEIEDYFTCRDELALLTRDRLKKRRDIWNEDVQYSRDTGQYACFGESEFPYLNDHITRHNVRNNLFVTNQLIREREKRGVKILTLVDKARLKKERRKAKLQ